MPRGRPPGPQPGPPSPASRGARGEGRGPGERLVRFDAVERTVHWASALLVLVLLGTGAALYVEPLAEALGRRRLVKEIHVWSGLALPLPLLLGAAGRRGSQLRRDLSRLARWSDDDFRWWRRRPVRLGKFNPGQKLNASLVGASLVVMLVTGMIMRWYSPFSDDWRTGATLVHDLFAGTLAIAVTGHVLLALTDRTALAAMARGTVPREWAAGKRPAWLAELEVLEDLEDLEDFEDFEDVTEVSGPTDAYPEAGREHH